MANMIQNLAGMGDMTEQVIATDFLLATKSAIKGYAAALAETATPEVRDTLRRQMDVAIGTHERITNYMMNKGYYHAYNPNEQIKVDMKAADTVLNMQQP
ncbi:spore coat protein [Pseudobacteroides cellulosolvens]|uniref:Coat F domain protein n=1 Tax=Pseudobacteroides cellulosolvens ATCC 35603 = DSM 2933 TaxID=398512 RepID=A0A0L6JU58_9FIRM|nr:spore coat protein [Pseudobacteroides cellulosolvens]KNY29353.1 Coat F domain protein [Pseudobacteroides cellulosolvens ATCC 35603 = DSM 2933]